MLRRIDVKVPDCFEEPLLGLAEKLVVSSFSSPCIQEVAVGGEEDFTFTGFTVVSFLFSTVEQDALAIEQAIGEFLIRENGQDCEIKKLDYADNEDWMKVFRNHFRTYKIGENLFIRPPWESGEPSNRDEVSIIIDPGMAFGTGTHETTRLCLNFLSRIKPKGKEYLDLGAGSGILSFYLLKQDAVRVTAVEIEGAAVENLKKNAALNGITTGLTVICGDLAQLPASTICDGVVANITTPVLLDNFDRISRWIKPGGTGIFSGVNSTNAPKIKKILMKSPWEKFSEEIEGEWHAFFVRKRSK